MRRFPVESSHTHVVGRAGELRDPAGLATDSVMRSRIKRTCPNDALVLAHLPLGNPRKETTASQGGSKLKGSVVVVAEPRTPRSGNKR